METSYPKPQQGVRFLLPRAAGQEVLVDGHLVPRVEVHQVPDSDSWSLTYDRRFGVTAHSQAELERWLPILAHAQAVGAGAPCFPVPKGTQAN